MSEHYLDLRDASVLKTRHLLMTTHAIGDVIEHAAMGAVVGPAGLGKTFAIRQALKSVTQPVVWLTFDTHPTPRLVADRLMLATTGRRAGRTKFEISEQMLTVLEERFRLVVIGEAQNLNRACFEVLRYLHDDPRTTFALLFDGGDGCWDILNAEPMLRSRIYRRVAFAPLTQTDVAALIPAYHPIYAGVSQDLLWAIDKAIARGRIREWAKFTHTAALICERLGERHLDQEIAESAITQIGTGS